MKSEPNVRVEDGYEIKFSIDDLAAKKKPEGWEGIVMPVYDAPRWLTDVPRHPQLCCTQ